MSGEVVVERLSFWRYLWNWIKLTFAGTKGFIGDVGLVIGLVLAGLHARWPKEVERVVSGVIPATAGYEDSVAFAPLYLAGAYLGIRALLTPWWLAKKELRARHEERLRLEADLTSERKASAELIEASQRRIAELEAPAPRVLVRATGDSQAPLALKNVGAIEAHNAKVRDLEYGNDYVEFDVVDPLEVREEEQMPGFRVMRRDGRNMDIFRITHFYSFTDPMDESFVELAERAGISGSPETWTEQEYGKVIAVGPRRFPLAVEYSDPTGRRRYETVYEWEKPWGRRDIVLHFIGWRELGN